ncbi:MAG: hypothetical protein U9Q20_04840 [Campylobacterota bacterium]|nr:hypothetical protein [Campylobacterota bacterium]
MPKRSFTLFEIIISIILISIIYLFAINSFTSKQKSLSKDINLDNIKSKLLNYQFENTITIKCIEDDYSCFVFIDDSKVPLKERVEKLFSEIPNVYRYNKDLDKIDFLDLELEQLQRYEVIFEFSCNKNRKCSELVVENAEDNQLYVFNDIYRKPIKLEHLNDLVDLIEKNEQEVKDAF